MVVKWLYFCDEQSIGNYMEQGAWKGWNAMQYADYQVDYMGWCVITDSLTHTSLSLPGHKPVPYSNKPYALGNSLLN